MRGYNDRTGEPTDCCAAAQLTAAAVLCPRCCWNLATSLARAQQDQEGAPFHPKAVGAIIAATAVLSIAPRLCGYTSSGGCVRVLLPETGDVLNSSSYVPI